MPRPGGKVSNLVLMSCTSCGLDVGAQARFCSNCGAPQATVSEERRFVSVLFADIVGFTALSEHRDPEQVKHFVDRTFERLAADITSFGGVVDKVIGDAIIALFGAPVAHEDDAERAVRAALEMQQTIARLATDIDPGIELRIGINTGEVLVGTTTAGGDYTAMGDVMNSAARLEEMAEPGWVLVGDNTKLATGDAITYESAGTLATRGRGEPIKAWVAIDAARPPGAQRIKGTVFVGRHHELAMLEAQGRLASSGQRAQLAVILGEAGIGKTRLANEAGVAMKSLFDARIVEGRALPYGEANVWWIVAEILRELFEISQDDSEAETASKVRGAVIDHLTGTGADTLSGPPTNADLERYITAVLHIFGHKTSLRGGDRNRNRSEVILAVSVILGAELARRPVVLMLSDMHWAGTPIWVLLEHALTDHARRRLVVIVTMRPYHNDRLPRGRNGLSVIQLGALDHSASLDLLNGLGVDLPAAKTAQLVERSGGNPYFLEELAGLVTNQQVDVAGEDVFPQFDIEHLDSLPATLRGSIAARLDAIDSLARIVLEFASVLGRTGPVDGLALLVSEGSGIDDISGALAVLAERDLLETNGKRFRFHSDLVRDVAYGRLTKTIRAQLHHRIASFLEQSGVGDHGEIRNSVVVAIAEHYRAAANLVGEVSNVPGVDAQDLLPKALYWLDQAGERALDVGAPIDATRWFGMGVELAPDDEVLARFVFGRARARTNTHDIAGARADLERLDDLVHRDPTLAARAMVVRGDVDRKAGDLEQAAARLRQAADQLAALDMAGEQALALRLLGLTEMFRCHDDLARQALDHSRAVAVAVGDRRSEAWALQTLAWHTVRTGHVDQANTMVTKAHEIFTELDDRGGLVWTEAVQAWVGFQRGHWAEARRLVKAVLPETQRRGDPLAEAMMLNLDASIELWTGHAQRALEIARRAADTVESVDDPTLLVQLRAVEGRALVSLGRIDEGTGVLDLAYLFADEADDRQSRRLAVIANAASAARLGEPERAVRWASRFDRIHDDPEVVGEADLVASLALAMLQKGAVSEAAHEISLGGGLGADSGGGHYANAVAALVAVTQGKLAEAEDFAAKPLGGNSTYLDRVIAHLTLAAVHHRRHNQHECVSSVDAALAEVAPTDDQPTRLLVDLVSAIAGRSSLNDAIHRMRRGGMDPSAWTTAWTQAFSRDSKDEATALVGE